MEKIYSNSQLMKKGLSVIISVILFTIGCATVQEKEKNVALERARAAYSQVQANPDISSNAQVAMHEAAQALQKAEQAKDVKEMEHLAYLAERQAQLAVAIADRKMAENERERLIKERDKILLEARERELERARSEAEAMSLEIERAKKEAEARTIEIERAKGEAAALARQAEQAKKEAEARTIEIEQAKKEAEAKALEIEQAKGEAAALARQAERARSEAEARSLELEQARKEAEAKAREAEMASMQAEQAMAQRKQLESELVELKAKQTERGIILTLGDILFAPGKAVLRSGSIRTIDTLSAFLKKYPNRNVLIEGHTDSIGSEMYNLGLSQHRADAVCTALTSKGIAAERITTKGYGEKYPVASNANRAGKQQNRRVEIIILDEGVSPEKMLR
jgi:outer membrane protein OmpA-like peptidoglycan-associated protein